jgi:hypothetical protein
MSWVRDLVLLFKKRINKKICMQITDRKIKVSLGNQQINKFQLFTDDWSKNNNVKSNKEVSKKHKENKEKERKFLRRISILSVTYRSDGQKTYRFNVAKVNKLLNT